MSTVDLLVTRRQSAGFTRVYKTGAVPDRPTFPYVVVGYAPSAPILRSLHGPATPLRRFTVQHFSRTPDGLEQVCADTFALFDGVILPTLAGSPFCEQEIATPISRDSDDPTVLGVTHTYRF